MNREPSELIVRAGRVFCAETGRDGPGEVVVRDGRIVETRWFEEAPSLKPPACEAFHFPNGLLLPGLVDFHAHPAGALSKYGVYADEHLLARGTTTVLSQGDAGAANWLRFRDDVIAKSRTRVRLAINFAAAGEITEHGCFDDPAAIDVAACLRAIDDGGPLIWGIAVNLSTHSCGRTDPRAVLKLALVVAEQSGKPLLFGPRRGADDFSWEEQFASLRPGDVATYCFDGGPQSIVQNGRVRPSVCEAQRRGVLFDLGHGAGSFDFPTAQAAIGEGFLPDTISTDLHRTHLSRSPCHDLPRTMSKLIAAGMTEHDALARVTLGPAHVLGLGDEIGTLRSGACADLTVLQCNAGAQPLTDTRGNERVGHCWEAVMTIREGNIVQHQPGVAGG